MKETFTSKFSFTLLCCCLLFAGSAKAQLAGTKTIPGDYATLAAAITDLNTQGVAGGGVHFQIAAGHTETASNLVITATGNALDSIVFEKAGTGANPLITAATGTGSLDGIILISGSDYVIFDGIDLLDPVTNATTNTQMEWGYGLFKTSATDGAKHITIKNSTITLQKTNALSKAIYAANHTATDTTSFVIAGSSGTNSCLKIFSNTISNVYQGIVLIGFNDPASYDSTNEIGVSGGNNISNFGGGSVAVNAIHATGQTKIGIANNTITGGNGTTENLNAIYTFNGQVGGPSDISIYNNFISLNTNGPARGISNGIGTSGTVAIYNNVIKDCFAQSSFSGIYHSTVPANLDIYNDSIVNIVLTNGYGTTYGINIPSSVNSIQFNHVRHNVISGFARTGGEGDMMAIYTAAGAISVDSNIIYNNQQTPAYTSQYNVGIYNFSTGTLSATGNNIYDLSNGRPVGIQTISALSFISYNSIHGLNTVGDQNVGGIAIQNGNYTIYRNKIYGLRNYTSGYDFGSGLNATAIVGIYVLGYSTNGSMYYNLIGDLQSPNSTNGNDIVAIAVDGSSSVNRVYYNTVFLDGKSTSTGFGSSVVHATPYITSLTLRNNIFVNTSETRGGAKSVVLRGYGSSFLPHYSGASNNNLFYAGPGPDQMIYFDGTSGDRYFHAYKTMVGPVRDSSSFTEMPHFIDTAGSSADFLRIDTAYATQIENGAQHIAGFEGDFMSDTSRIATNYPLTGQANGGGQLPDAGAFEGDYKTAASMTYVSGTTTQFTGEAYRNVARQAIIGIEIVTEGPLNALNLDSISLSTGNTTNLADISNARLYYSYSSNAFDTSLFFGAADPSSGTFTIAGNQKLLPGTNYLWLTYDVRSSAVPADTIDAICSTIYLSSGPVVPTITDPAGYKVVPVPLAGLYAVGVGGNFTTLTSAVTALNTRGISSSVTFELTDALYRLSETFPIVINSIGGSSPSDTVVIKPAAGINPVIRAATNAAIILNGADYVTINGANSATDTTNLTIRNSGSAAIWAQNNSEGDSCMNNVFKNIFLRASEIGIGFGGNGYIGGTNAGSGHHFNTVTKCNILTSSYLGIYSSGFGTQRKNKGNVFTQNTLNGGSIYVAYEDSVLISKNTIAPGQYTNYYGISLGFEYIFEYEATNGMEVTNAIVTENKIGPIDNFSTVGIAVAPASSGTTIIANNLVHDLSNGIIAEGIYIGGGTGSSTKVYYNTVYMNNTSDAYDAFSYGVAIGSNDPAVELKNNIIYNSQNFINPNGHSYGIGFGSSTFTNMISDHNAFYASGTDSRFATYGALGLVVTELDSLSQLQVLIGQDVNSIAIDPVFDFTSGYYPQAGSVVRGGTPLPGFEYDINGFTRDIIVSTIGAYEAPPTFDDAGVTTVKAENGELRILVNNFGSNMLSSFVVNYSLNNGTPVTQTFVQNIDPYDTATVVMSPFIIPAGINTLKVYTTLPNGIADSKPLNDTSTLYATYPMAGVYTIGGTTPDFANFTEAVTSLSIRGVSDSVIFKVRSGTYTENIILHAVTGATNNNTVTFISEAEHMDSVTLTFNVTDPLFSSTIKLNDVSFIQFKHLSILVTGSASFDNVISFNGNVSYNVIDHCRITAPASSGGFSHPAIYSNNYSGDHCVISNNIITNGSQGIYLERPATGIYPDGWIIENNTIDNVHMYSIFAGATKNIKINNNTITTSGGVNGGLNSYIGIYCVICNDSLEIIGNTITSLDGFGLKMQYCDGGMGTRGGIIANNVISMRDGEGIFQEDEYSYATYNQHFLHNTVNIVSATRAAAYFSIDKNLWNTIYSTRNEIKNNVFSNTGGGYALLLPLKNTFLPFVESDYNYLYSSGPNTVRRSVSTNYVHDSEYVSLEAWQNASLQDLHSVSYHTAFTDLSSLRPDLNDSSVWAIHGRAIHLDSTLINTDINGTPRPSTPAKGVPDMGAYEFTPTSTPPLAIVSGSLAPDSIQIFFSPYCATDTVAKIEWEATTLTPTKIEVRQYAGILPPGITANEHAMYFFTDIKDSGNAPYNFALDVHYKDMWQGTNPTEADIAMARNDENGWMLVAAISATVTDTVRNVMSAPYLPSFGLFTGTDVFAPLPVKLLAFSGTKSNEDALLNWTTATEINSDYFEIERSFDGKTFVKAGNVKASGNSNTMKYYTFTDHSVFAEKTPIVYYRLRMVDGNGSSEYSKMIRITDKENSGLQAMVYPNPFSTQTAVQLESQNVSQAILTVTDLSGRTLSQQTVETTKGVNTFELTVTGNMKAGAYFLSVDMEGQRSVYKLIKQ